MNDLRMVPSEVDFGGSPDFNPRLEKCGKTQNK